MNIFIVIWFMLVDSEIWKWKQKNSLTHVLTPHAKRVYRSDTQTYMYTFSNSKECTLPFRLPIFLKKIFFYRPDSRNSINFRKTRIISNWMMPHTLISKFKDSQNKILWNSKNLVFGTTPMAIPNITYTKRDKNKFIIAT